MVGQNLSLKLEIQGDNQLNEVHSSRTVNWTTPNKRYSFAKIKFKDAVVIYFFIRN